MTIAAEAGAKAGPGCDEGHGHGEAHREDANKRLGSDAIADTPGCAAHEPEAGWLHLQPDDEEEHHDTEFGHVGVA